MQPLRKAIRPTVRLLTPVLVAAAACAGLPLGASELLFTIRIENRAGGLVKIQRAGADAVIAGRVTRGCSRLVPTFPAAAYVKAPAVAASSSHGIRLRLPSQQSRPMGISIQSREFVTMPTGYGGHIPGPSAIHTDIPAGSGIFRELSPLVGDAVLLERQEVAVKPEPDWSPSESDIIVIECRSTDVPPAQLLFENRASGAVTAVGSDGVSKLIARVRQPVGGVGRFDGTSYTGVGQLNTNHPGVITISSASASRPVDEGQPPELRGGFEIQPSHHATTQPYMPQALIVEPLDPAETLEGAPPLFSGTLWLGDGSGVVEIRPAGGSWIPIPEMTGKIDNAFSAEGLSAATGKQLGAVEEIRLTVQQRTAESVKKAVAGLQAAARDAPPLPSPPLEWTLDFPYPTGAALAVFMEGARTISVTNQQPFRATLEPKSQQVNLEARIRDINGVTLETRRVKATMDRGRWKLTPASPLVR